MDRTYEHAMQLLQISRIAVRVEVSVVIKVFRESFGQRLAGLIQVSSASSTETSWR